MALTFYTDQITAAADRHQIGAYLVEAIVLVESAGHTDAFRFEPGFYDRYLAMQPQYKGQNPRRISSSYGLMQIMFTTAQQYGFAGPPEKLFIPEIGLDYGCLYLAHLLKWATPDLPWKAVAAYNAGQGNWQSDRAAAYVDKVQGAYRRVRAEAGLEGLGGGTIKA